MQNLKNSALILKALAHETRLAIVLGLMRGDGCNVSKIIDNLGLPQSTISQHLTILRSAGIVEGYKKGSEVCYKIINEIVIKILKNMGLLIQ